MAPMTSSLARTDAQPNAFDQTLSTTRLLLRPLEAGDADMIWPDMTDREISKLMAWDAHTDKAQTQAFLTNEVVRRRERRGVTWAVMLGDQFCGIVSVIGIVRTHRALTFDRGELAYWVARRHQRQGIATEAARAVIPFAFAQFGLHKIVVSHHSGNMASRSLIQRLGFRHIGVQRAEFQKDGMWFDHWLYEMLAQDHHWSP